jgi:hypothetical protein
MVWQELPGYGDEAAWAICPERPQMDWDDWCGEWIAAEPVKELSGPGGW